MYTHSGEKKRNIVVKKGNKYSGEKKRNIVVKRKEI
jgi:hypothetical protein